MTKPFAWIDAQLRSNGLIPPDWVAVVLHDEANQDEPYEIGHWWCLDDAESASAAYEQINKKYSERLVIPFARDKGSDDIACFVLSDPASNAPIVVIHDYAPPQIAARERYDSFEEWADAVKRDYHEGRGWRSASVDDS